MKSPTQKRSRKNRKSSRLTQIKKKSPEREQVLFQTDDQPTNLTSPNTSQEQLLSFTQNEQEIQENGKLLDLFIQEYSQDLTESIENTNEDDPSSNPNNITIQVHQDSPRKLFQEVETIDFEEERPNFNPLITYKPFAVLKLSRLHCYKCGKCLNWFKNYFYFSACDDCLIPPKIRFQ